MGIKIDFPELIWYSIEAIERRINLKKEEGGLDYMIMGGDVCEDMPIYVKLILLAG